MKEKFVWGDFKIAWPYYSMRQEPGLGAGQPDVLVLDRLGRIGLVELKAPDSIELNPSQWIWHEMFWKNRGKTVVVTCDRYFDHRIGWRIFVPKFHPRELFELTPAPVPGAKFVEVVAQALGLKI
jgi:hypothetical protein